MSNVDLTETLPGLGLQTGPSSSSQPPGLVLEMRILVAEDDSLARELLARHLVQWGYKITVARDGDEAWRALTSPDRPSLIVLDWMMPGLSGPEICRKLREANGQPFCYVVLLTSRSEPTDLIAGLTAGADDFVIKPFHPAELKARLEVGCRLIQQQEQLARAYDSLKEHLAHDEVTGLWNRKTIREFLDQELARSDRALTGVGVITADVDHFKAVNDTWGHATGDIVLSAVANRMREELRSSCKVGRLGGEEFLIVVPDCPGLQEAFLVAERMRQNVSLGPIDIPCGSVLTTISLGATLREPRQQGSAKLLLEVADRALYRAKAGGRNCTIVTRCEAQTAQLPVGV